MDFTFSTDQEQFRASLRRFLADKAPAATSRLAAEGEAGYDPGIWRQMTEQLGLPGLHLGEQYGGAGSGLLEPGIVMEELGRALTPSPYFATLMAALTIQAVDNAQAHAALLPRLAAGSILTIADYGASVGGAVNATPSTNAHHALLDGDGGWVAHLQTAEALLVTAEGPDGRQVFLVERDAPGMTTDRHQALDLTRPLDRIRLDHTPAELLGPISDPGYLTDTFRALLACEMVGGAQAVLDLAVAHAKDRHQFNRPIGSFQAVKHRCADMLIALDGARAAAQYALLTADQHSPELAVVAPLAKAEASEAFTFAAGSAIQILGGIGFTWEHPAHLYFRRAWADATLFGTQAVQRARVAELIGL